MPSPVSPASAKTAARQPNAPASAASPRVWAIGGGKGGVGKSVVTSSLAIALSAGGPRCAVVDADLGGANLHTMLGVSQPEYTLADFVSGRVKELSQVLCPTAVPGLSLVSGARAALEMANPKHAQKQKFIRHLRRLDVAHVFVDLGAGTSFNVLDPFVAADERVVVVTPEPTSIENAYHFLRAAFFRWLRDVARGEHRELLEEVIVTGRRSGLSPRQLLELASRRDPGVAYKLRKRARAFAPKLIVNQVDDDDDRRVGYEMVAAAWRHLGVRLDFVGTLDRDASVRASVTRQQPVLQLFPGCGFSTELREVVGRIRARETLGPEQAPLARPLSNATPPLATHGVAEVEVSLPRLGPRPPPPPLPAIDLEWPGRSLRRCREHLGLSLRDAEERSRIRHVAAIEAERYSDLPPEPYLEAQVRSYAEVLGIRDAVLLAARFAQAARKTQPVSRRGLLARLRRAPSIDVLPPRAHS